MLMYGTTPPSRMTRSVIGNTPASEAERSASEARGPVTARRVATRSPSFYGKAGLLLVLTVCIVLWGVLRSPWYQQRRWARLPLAALERERDAHPNDPVFLTYLGLHLNEANRFAEAQPVLERAVGLDPDAPLPREQWARALLGSGQVSAAFVELRQYVGTHPRSCQGHMALGKFYMTQRALLRAEEEFAAAV